MGQYWHIALKKGNKNAKVDPLHFGEGAKFLEFAFSPKTLLVLYKLLKEDWYDCQLAIVGDDCTSLEGKETHKYDILSLLQLGITEIDHKYTNAFQKCDSAMFERMGFTQLRKSIKIHKDKFYVVNTTMETYIVIGRKGYDTEACVAALSWMLADVSSMGRGPKTIQPERNSKLKEKLGYWAYDSIRVLDDDDNLDSLKEYKLDPDFDSLIEELSKF